MSCHPDQNLILRLLNEYWLAGFNPAQAVRMLHTHTGKWWTVGAVANLFNGWESGAAFTVNAKTLLEQFA